MYVLLLEEMDRALVLGVFSTADKAKDRAAKVALKSKYSAALEWDYNAGCWDTGIGYRIEFCTVDG